MAAQEKKYKVIFSTKATQMLVAHAAFLAQVSEQAAERLVMLVEAAARSLETMPHRCPWFVGDLLPTHTYRKLIVEGRYLMIYQVQADTVFIDFVVDGKQDYEWLIR